MARNAHPEITEQRILEAARDLFMEKGYEKTSIQNIVDRLGDLSKGAIYHHFKSKEAILDRLNSADWDYSQGERDRIMARTDLTGLEKMRAMLTISINNEEHQKLNEVALPFLDNPTTLASNLNFWATELPKHWLPIIEEGIQDGSIPTEYPQEAAELISLLANYWLLTRFYPATHAELKHRIQCLATMLASIGVPVFNQELVDQTYVFYASFTSER